MNLSSMSPKRINSAGYLFRQPTARVRKATMEEQENEVFDRNDARRQMNI